MFEKSKSVLRPQRWKGAPIEESVFINGVQVIDPGKLAKLASLSTMLDFRLFLMKLGIEPAKQLDD